MKSSKKVKVVKSQVERGSKKVVRMECGIGEKWLRLDSDGFKTELNGKEVLGNEPWESPAATPFCQHFAYNSSTLDSN